MRYIKVQDKEVPILYDLAALEKTAEQFGTLNPMEVLTRGTEDQKDRKTVKKSTANAKSIISDRIDMVVLMAQNAADYLGTPMVLSANQLRHIAGYQFNDIMKEVTLEIAACFHRELKGVAHENVAVDGYLEDEHAKNP